MPNFDAGIARNEKFFYLLDSVEHMPYWLVQGRDALNRKDCAIMIAEMLGLCRSKLRVPYSSPVKLGGPRSDESH